MRTNGKRPVWMKSPSATRLLTAAGIGLALVCGVLGLIGREEWDSHSPPPPGPSTVPLEILSIAAGEPAEESTLVVESVVAPEVAAIPEVATVSVATPETKSSPGDSVRPWLADGAYDAWLTAVSPQVDAAQQVCTDKAIALLESIKERFKEERERIPAYAEEIVGLESKFSLVTGITRWNNDHRQHQLAALERHLLTMEEIDDLIREIESSIMQDELDCDDASFIAARVDVPAETVPSLKLQIHRNEIAACLNRILDAAEAVSKVDAGMAIGTEVVSNRVSNSIAGSLMEALGVEDNFVNSWIAQDLVQRVTDPIAQAASRAVIDTTSEITAMVEHEVYNLQLLLIDGISGEGGIITQIVTFHKERSDHRLRRLFEAYAAAGTY